MTELLDVVAIDGPAGAGKSTVARGLAKELGYRHLDTGSMYRAVTFTMLARGVPIEDTPRLHELLAELTVEIVRPGVVAVDGRELAAELRTGEVDAHVSPVAALSPVRRAMAALQRAQASYGPLVAEGRDMGSVVFPDARWKFYLDASAEERARRRERDYEGMGKSKPYPEILAGIRERDRIDSSREDSPLVCAEGAERIDTDALDAAGVVALLARRVRG